MKLPVELNYIKLQINWITLNYKLNYNEVTLNYKLNHNLNYIKLNHIKLQIKAQWSVIHCQSQVPVEYCVYDHTTTRHSINVNLDSMIADTGGHERRMWCLPQCWLVCI